jgi:hypothetical protein
MHRPADTCLCWGGSFLHAYLSVPVPDQHAHACTFRP